MKITKATLLNRMMPVFLLVYLASMLWFFIQLQEPAKLLAEPEAEGDFSAQRAFEHVKIIAKQPHPTGSIANAQVRDYLVATLKNLGAEVEVQRKLQTYQHTPHLGHARFAYIENVVAHWSGQKSEKALLVMSHYDSVPYGSGAGDNASGVATVLEVLRALNISKHPLPHGLTVLFSDGEELGLIGAQSFFGEHPWAKDIALVLNFDARGSKGPVAMYQTSANNGALIDAFNEFAPHPYATSMINAIMQKMPNPTDLSIAIAAGKPSMNFAFIDGFSDYHTATDTPQNLSLDSLQHMGSYALAAIRYFIGSDLSSLQAPDKYYFNPVADMFITYAPWVDWLVALAVIMLLIFANSQAWTQQALSIKEILRGMVGATLVLLLPSLLVLMLHAIVRQYISSLEFVINHHFWFIGWGLLGTGGAIWVSGLVQNQFNWRDISWLSVLILGVGFLSGLGWFGIIFGLAICILLALLTRKPLNREAWVAGSQWLLTLFAVLLLVFLGGAAHLLLVPLLFISIAQVFSWQLNSVKFNRIIWLLAGLPAIALLGNAAHIFDLLLGFSLPVVVVVTLLLLLLMFAPLLSQNSVGSGKVICLVGLVVTVWTAQLVSWSAQNPQPVSLFVLHDANQKRTFWASNDKQLSSWHRTVLGDDPELKLASSLLPNIKQATWVAPIEKTLVDEPQVKLVAVDQSYNQVKLRIFPSSQGDTVSVWLPAETDLQGWQVDGQALQWAQGDGKRWWSLTGFAVPKTGFELTLIFDSEKHCSELILINEHEGLPDSLKLPIRSDLMMRDRHTKSDTTLVVERINLSNLIQ